MGQGTSGTASLCVQRSSPGPARLLRGASSGALLCLCLWRMFRGSENLRSLAPALSTENAQAEVGSLVWFEAGRMVSGVY